MYTANPLLTPLIENLFFLPQNLHLLKYSFKKNFFYLFAPGLTSGMWDL